MRSTFILTTILMGTSPAFAQTGMANSNFDTDAIPIRRTTIGMPLDGDRSGRCKMRYDINESGNTTNIGALFCTEEIFLDPALNSVRSYKFIPAKKGGQDVYRSGVESSVDYRLFDHEGNILPEQTTDKYFHPNSRQRSDAVYKVGLRDNTISAPVQNVTPATAIQPIYPATSSVQVKQSNSLSANSQDTVPQARDYLSATSSNYVTGPSVGLDIRVTTKIPQTKIDQTCKAAFGHINIVAAGGTANDVKPVCTTLTRKSFTTDLEDHMYDILGTANDKLIYAEYYAKSDQYSSYRWDRHQKIMAPLTSQLPTKKIPSWVVSSEIGSELDHEKLSQLSLHYELISVSFLTSNSKAKELQHVYNWVTGGKRRYVNYTRYGAYVNLEYRLTANYKNQTLLDTTFTQSERVAALDKCIDPAGGGRHTTCKEDRSRYHNWTRTDPEPHKLAIAILTQKSIIFDKLTPFFYQRGEQRFSEGYRPKDKYYAVTTLPENSQSKASAIMPNLETYKQSFRDISGGRAQFAIKSVGLFKAAEPRLRETSGSRGRNLSAGADAAQTQCIAEIQLADAQEKREAKKTLGLFGSALGLPAEAVTIGTMASIAVVDMIELTFDQQEEVNRCVSAKGY